jgi:hypothetical protein
VWAWVHWGWRRGCEECGYLRWQGRALWGVCPVVGSYIWDPKRGSACIHVGVCTLIGLPKIVCCWQALATGFLLDVMKRSSDLS